MTGTPRPCYRSISIVADGRLDVCDGAHWAFVMKKSQRSRPRGVKARSPWCSQSSAHPSRKAREGWGTLCVVVPAEGWATRHPTVLVMPAKSKPGSPASANFGGNSSEAVKSHISLRVMQAFFAWHRCRIDFLEHTFDQHGKPRRPRPQVFDEDVSRLSPHR